MKLKKHDYIFEVSLQECGAYDVKGKVLRKIQISENKSLYSFAEAITQAFSFNFDHCFGFYDNLKNDHESKNAYELFVDIGEEPTVPMANGVKNTKISKAFKNPGEKMLFVFDYGDDWHFIVELKEKKVVKERNIKPATLESIGDAPEQYPPCEEEIVLH